MAHKTLGFHATLLWVMLQLPILAWAQTQESVDIQAALASELAIAQKTIGAVTEADLVDVKGVIQRLQRHRDTIHLLVAKQLKRLDFVSQSFVMVIAPNADQVKARLKASLDKEIYEDMRHRDLSKVSKMLAEFSQLNLKYQAALRHVDTKDATAKPDPLAKARQNTWQALGHLSDMADQHYRLEKLINKIHDRIGYHNPTTTLDTSQGILVAMTQKDLEDLYHLTVKLGMIRDVMCARIFRVILLAKPFFKPVVNILGQRAASKRIYRTIVRSLDLGWRARAKLWLGLKALRLISKKFIQRLNAVSDQRPTVGQLETVFKSVRLILKLDSKLAPFAK